MWPDLPNPISYTRNGKEWFSFPIDSFINKLLTTTPPLPNVDRYSYSEACFWGLSDLHEYILESSLNFTGLLVQGATLLEITAQLITDIGHECNYMEVHNVYTRMYIWLNVWLYVYGHVTIWIYCQHLSIATYLLKLQRTDSW